ncbi:uncharacterized protein LOC142587666 isoform X1 [Dermacentor variabilis]|uniref:uncharacterized protein LOC142587666 isoform X1 n=1 Tax=Dermacentor variabilis TaxID=34621 RepID=UPI003F5BB4FF
MPRHCCAQGCYNSIVGRDSPSHTFPKDEKVRKLWIRACQPSRPAWKPLKNDFICADHFVDDDYATSPAVLKSLGMPLKGQRLKPDAVPSVFSRKRKAGRISGAFEKRRRKEIIDQILQEQPTTEKACHTEAVHIQGPQCDACEMHTPPIDHVPFEEVTQAVSREGSAEACTNSRQSSECEAHQEKCSAALLQQFAAEPHAANERQITAKPLQADAAVQTSMICRDWATQVNIHGDKRSISTSSFMPPRSSTPLPEWTDASEDEMDENENRNQYDPSYVLSDVSLDKDSTVNTAVPLYEERKFIVFESSLDELLSVCPLCSHPCRAIDKTVKGILLQVTRMCINHHVSTWATQPIINWKAAGSLLLSAAVFFSGCKASKFYRALRSVGVACSSDKTHFRVQNAFVIPAVTKVWTHHQNVLFDEAIGRPLQVAGDGRADSPGHSAKYGTYSILDIEQNKVLHIETLQSNETKGSNHMELEGLRRTLQICEANGLEISTLVTDRHSQIKAFTSKETCIEHSFDCWHVAKMLKKKLTAAAKLKKFQELTLWIPAVINHLYWCALSSRAQPELILAKWCSLVRHVVDIHVHDESLYLRCEHEPLPKKKWLEEGSPAHQKLKAIVLNKALLKDIPRLSTSAQTFAVECFHSTITQFAPKNTHFGYSSMVARTRLAALHYNENSARQQATTDNGTKRWLVKYPKAKKAAVVAPVKESCTYGYVKELLECAVDLCQNASSYREASARSSVNVPPPLSSNFERADKEALVAAHTRRFNILPTLQ